MSEGRPESDASPGDLRARLRGSMTREYKSWERSQANESAPNSFRTNTPSSTPPRVERSSLDITTRLRGRLVDELTRTGRLEASDDEIVELVHDFVERVLDEEDLALNDLERSRLVETLSEEALGIGPLAPLMADPAVTSGPALEDLPATSGPRAAVHRPAGAHLAVYETLRRWFVSGHSVKCSVGRAVGEDRE